jgi:hypothetical protein
MALPATIDACRLDLFTPENELRAKYTDVMVSRILRIRDSYNWWLGNPDSKDKQVVDLIMSHNPSISRASAYSDLNILKALIPMLTQNSRDFHRIRFNEMILESYQIAKRRKDTKAMVQAATNYAKFNRVDLEDEMTMPYDEIVVQPFTATEDVSVLGLKPIPNVYERIEKLRKEFLRDIQDVEDVEAEEADLQEDILFAPLDKDNGK